MNKKIMLKGLQYLLLSGIVLWAGAALAGPLDEVIAGAKKEGKVSVKLRSGFTPTAMGRLRKEIREMFGSRQ